NGSLHLPGHCGGPQRAGLGRLGRDRAGQHLQDCAAVGRAVSRERPRILLVDDEPRLLDAVRMNLEVEGFEVFEAHDGAEALERIRKILPDLVVLDVMMPRMDGLETLADLRRFSSVPVIMLTVKADDSDVVLGLERGADDYVAKPFSQQVLLSR